MIYALIGVAAAFLYILQPVDALRAPIDWLTASMTQYTGVGIDWLIGTMPKNEVVALLALILVVATPGVAGLLINLVAPMARRARFIFGMAMLLYSFGAFGALPWEQALGVTFASAVIGFVLVVLSGPLMEVLAAFMSVILGLSQVKMLFSSDGNPHLDALVAKLASSHLISGGPEFWRWVAISAALVPLAVVITILAKRIQGEPVPIVD